jgi:hypothetical protein
MRKKKKDRPKSDEPTLRKLADEETDTDADRLRCLVEMVRQDPLTRADDRGKLRAFLQGLVPQGQKTQPLDEQETTLLYREFGEMLRGLVADPPRRWPLPSTYAFLTRREPGGPVEFIGEGRTIDNVRWGVVNLLLSTGENLLACAECGEPFVRKRRQEYCSERCSQKVRDRRRRG